MQQTSLTDTCFITLPPLPPSLQLHLSQPVGGGQQQQQQVRSHAQQQPPQPRVPSGPLRPEQVAKMLSELDVVRRNVDIMNEVLTETEPGTASPDDSQLLEVSGRLELLQTSPPLSPHPPPPPSQELNNTLHQMQGRVAALIERCTDEVILGEQTTHIHLGLTIVGNHRYFTIVG